MDQNQDPFTYQFGPSEQGAPSLPPRPRRRPVPAPGAASSPSPTSTAQSTPFSPCGDWSYYPSSPMQSPPTYGFSPPDDPNNALDSGSGYYGYSPPEEPFSPMRSPQTYTFSPPNPGHGPDPSTMPPQGAANPGYVYPESQQHKLHSFFGSVKKLAKDVFRGSLSQGFSAAMGTDPASPYASSAAPNLNQPSSNMNQPAPYPGMPGQSGMPGMPGGGQIIVNGVPLGQADLLTLQAAIGTVIPGNYWYDSISGAYGTVGGPCTGFLPTPGFALGGGPLAPDASGRTGTGVFINGREIHSLDVAGLQRMGATVLPGRWWVRADGSYGAEGSFQVLGNLRMQAAAAANPYTNGGNASTWQTSQGNCGGSDGKGFSYIHGRGFSWYSQ